MCTGGRATHRLQHRAAMKTPQMCPVRRASTLAPTLVRPAYNQISASMHAVAIKYCTASSMQHLMATIYHTPLQELRKVVHPGSICRTVSAGLG